MKFTVLIPTFSNGKVIRTAIESALSQDADLELFVVADGAPPETHAVLDEYEARDSRVRAFRFEKGARNGEAWRHIALQQADSDAVCYLSDDDFWFPGHLAAMQEALAAADLAHTRQVVIMPDFTVFGYAGDLGDPARRARMLVEKCNFFGLTVAGHRLASYRRLPEGWAPAPEDIATDYHMWRKWLRADGMRFFSSTKITALHIPRVWRGRQTPAACDNETGFWREVFADPAMIEALRALLPANEDRIPLRNIVAFASGRGRTGGQSPAG